VNDRLDVAVAAGADVVHLGQDDLPLADALRLRTELGRPELVVGFSTHNAEQARAAAAEGADYIGFGPVFATRSKLNPDPTAGVQALAAVCRDVAVPVVAIGGIHLDAVPVVAQAGAAAAALISAVAGASDPAAAGRQVNAVFGA
jgi:thiamine-phosphate pyrophosphorylase